MKKKITKKEEIENEKNGRITKKKKKENHE